MIVFGATIPITGPKAEEGRYTRDGYQFYVDAANQRGGIVVGGRAYKVRLHYYDDASDPARVGPLYERLIAQDRVTFLLGPYSSQLTVAAVPIAEKNRVPMVAAHGSAESLYPPDNRYVFSIRHYRKVNVLNEP
jgi:branched-chain amino acid transport system substrate-binding protein